MSCCSAQRSTFFKLVMYNLDDCIVIILYFLLLLVYIILCDVLFDSVSIKWDVTLCSIYSLCGKHIVCNSFFFYCVNVGLDLTTTNF